MTFCCILITSLTTNINLSGCKYNKISILATLCLARSAGNLFRKFSLKETWYKHKLTWSHLNCASTLYNQYNWQVDYDIELLNLRFEDHSLNFNKHSAGVSFDSRLRASGTFPSLGWKFFRIWTRMVIYPVSDPSATQSNFQ